MDNNSICYDEIRTGNQGGRGGGVKKYCFEISDWSGSPNNTQSDRRRGHHIILSL